MAGIQEPDPVRVSECFDGTRKRYAMLTEVGTLLRFIPLKFHHIMIPYRYGKFQKIIPLGLGIGDRIVPCAQARRQALTIVSGGLNIDSETLSYHSSSTTV